jgi:hypothetical protein
MTVALILAFLTGKHEGMKYMKNPVQFALGHGTRE